MRRSVYNVCILYGVFIFMGGISYAQNTTLVKTLEQNFKVIPTVSFQLNNKYGDVVINGWDKNECEVKIKLTTYGKTDDDTKKLMDRVEFDFNVADDFVDIETVMDRSKGVLSEFFNAIGDYSKSLLNKNELDIDFEIWMPKGGSIDVINKFGDIAIYDLHGKITIEQSHGNFNANNFSNLARINVNYGNIRINSFKNGSISIKGGELEIQKADKVTITSKQSRLYLKSINHLTLESTGDRIRITELNEIKGRSNFSTIDIYQLNTTCKLNQSFGEMTLHSISGSFQEIDLTSKSTDYSVNLPVSTPIGLDLTAREDRLLMFEPLNEQQKSYTDEKGKIVHLTGYYGNDPTPNATIYISSTGEVSIHFTTK